MSGSGAGEGSRSIVAGVIKTAGAGDVVRFGTANGGGTDAAVVAITGTGSGAGAAGGICVGDGIETGEGVGIVGTTTETGDGSPLIGLGIEMALLAGELNCCGSSR